MTHCTYQSTSLPGHSGVFQWALEHRLLSKLVWQLLLTGTLPGKEAYRKSRGEQTSL